VRPVLAVVILLVFGIAFVLALPFVEGSAFFQSLNPGEQYIVYNLGIVAIFSGVLGYIAARALREKASVGQLLVNGLGLFILFSFTVDMWEPPFAVAPDGTIAITATSANLAGTAVDYATAWFYSTYFGISGSNLYYSVYLVTPVIAIVAAVLLLGSKKFLGLYFQ
jgi:hypothetical protein